MWKYTSHQIWKRTFSVPIIAVLTDFVFYCLPFLLLIWCYIVFKSRALFCCLPCEEWQGCIMCPHVGRPLSNFFILALLGLFSRGLSKWAINFKKAKPCCVQNLALKRTYTHKALVLVIAQWVNFNKQFLSWNANVLQMNCYLGIAF